MQKVIASVFSLVLLCTFVFPASSFATPTDTKQSCITLYEDSNYKGKKSDKFCDAVANLKKYHFNDIASSLKVEIKNGKSVGVCEKPNFEGKCVLFSKNNPKLSDQAMDNKISSIYIMEME